MISNVRVSARRAAAVLTLAMTVFGSGSPASSAEPTPAPSTFLLANGMLVCVIPDTRVPVVTHMVWYRIGAADDPAGRSGLAHFVEHLMFKGTATTKSGEFTRKVTGLGGRHNALTTHDTTTYFQRVSRENLGAMMALEADRMQGLILTEAEVATERDVVREERRGSIDAAPIAALNEQMLAQLYQNHPYRRPVLGWAHEIASLGRDDATKFYGRHYAPYNAILVVAGDVTADEVRAMAEATYGKNKPSATLVPRQRPSDPAPLAMRWLRLEDARAGAPLLLRYYDVPGWPKAKSGEAEALSLLARILGGDDTSRLYRHLVLETKVAVHAGADYQGGGLDRGRMALLAVSASEQVSGAVEEAIDRVLGDVVRDGIGQDELRRAKRALEAEHVFETDDQEKRARRYGEALTTGRSLADIEAAPARIEAISASDVQRVAATYLDARRSITGVLARPTAKSAPTIPK